MIILYAAGHTEQLSGIVRHHAHDTHPAVQRSLQSFPVWIMGRDLDGTHQLFPFEQLHLRQTIETAAAQIPGDALDIAAAEPVAEHQHTPVQLGSNSCSSLGNARHF